MSIERENFSREDFESISSEWLRMKSPELKPSSIAKYRNILQNYLIPEYGDREIRSLTRKEILTFSRELHATEGRLARGLSANTVNGILSVLRNVFRYASREKGIHAADIADIYVSKSKSPLRVLSMNEQLRLSEFLLRNLSFSNLGIMISLYTGLRIGEICALQWQDLLLDEPCLYVRKTMQRIQLFSDFGKRTKVVILTPKSSCSIRTIPIPKLLLSLLIAEQKDKDAFLLTGRSDAYMEPRCLENHFKTAVKACNIHDVHFHVLRHTFATRYVELGFDPKSLSEILGHANVNITMNRYVHPSMELKKENMDKLSDLLAAK